MVTKMTGRLTSLDISITLFHPTLLRMTFSFIRNKKYNLWKKIRRLKGFSSLFQGNTGFLEVFSSGMYRLSSLLLKTSCHHKIKLPVIKNFLIFEIW